MQVVMIVSTIAVFTISSVVEGPALRAGVAVKTITPSKPVYLAGLANNRLSEGVHDDIYARCLMLSDGRTEIGFVSLDLIGLTRGFLMEVLDELKARGVDSERLIISCTHLHSGPDTIGLWGPSEEETGVDREYMGFLRERIIDVVLEARGNMKPAVMKLGSAQLPERGVSRNIREPDIIDRELTLMMLETQDGLPIGTLINFAAHPETLWSDNHLITSDYVAYVYRDVERELGGRVVFLNGALGGMVTVDNVDHTFEEAERIGTILARKAIEAARNAMVNLDFRIKFEKSVLKIPLENEKFRLTAEMGILPYVDFSDEVVTEVNVIRIGDATFATFPGEAFPKLGLKVKEAMKTRYKFVIGLANDELGYILPEEDFNKELYSYERSMSVGSKIGTITVEEIINGLQTLDPRPE